MNDHAHADAQPPGPPEMRPAATRACAASLSHAAVFRNLLTEIIVIKLCALDLNFIEMDKRLKIILTVSW